MLFVPEDDIFSQNPLPSDIPITRDSFVLLSSPVGLQSFYSSYISSRVKKIQSIIPLLPDREDSQMESALLCSCFSIPHPRIFLFSTNLSSKLHQEGDFLF